MTTLKGHRLPDGSSIEDVAKLGDYLLLPDRHAIWCVLPNGVVNRIPVDEKGGRGQPPVWVMVEHEDRTITLDPSISLRPIPGELDSGWHGWLRRGVWETA